MEANEKNLLVGLLTKSLNKTDEEVSDLLYKKAEDSDEISLKEDALDLVLDADATRVSNIKKSAKPDEKALKDQYLKGVKDGKEELEASIKKLAGLESGAIGDDLVKEAITYVSECNVLTDDQIKAHHLYRELEKDRVPKEVHEQLKAEFDDFKLNQDKSQRLSKIKTEALSVLNSLNPVISENASVAQTRQQDYLAKFEPYDYEFDDNGKPFVKKNGTRVEDAHGNPVKFEDFAKDIASKNYDFKANDDKGNAGNRNTGGNGSGGMTDIPKDEKDYLTRMSQAKTGEERIAIHKAWTESQK